jgi:hypothetical protein
LFGLVTLVSLGFARWRKRLLATYSILFFIILIGWWFAISPSNERQWQPDLAKLPYSTVDGDTVTVHDIRNFDYRSEFDYKPAYYTKTYDINKLEGIDLFAVYWMGPAIAHTIMSFNFGDKDYLAVSIEVRKELNEGYSTIKGFFGSTNSCTLLRTSAMWFVYAPTIVRILLKMFTFIVYKGVKKMLVACFWNTCEK